MKRCLLILCLALTGCSDPNEKGNADFVDAVQLIEQAEFATSAKTAHSLLLKARETLNQIITRYPGSDVAVRLASGERLGSISMRSLDAMIAVRKLELDVMIEARRLELCFEEPNYGCVIAMALQTANGIDGDWQTAWALAELASKLH